MRQRIARAVIRNHLWRGELIRRDNCFHSDTPPKPEFPFSILNQARTDTGSLANANLSLVLRPKDLHGPATNTSKIPQNKGLVCFGFDGSN
jgi:hypothetical protein